MRSFITNHAARLYYFKNSFSELWPILFGLTVLYVPTFFDLFTGLWSTEEQAHGPIIFLLALWLMFRLWPAMLKQSTPTPSNKLGWLLMTIGLLLYIIGRSQQVHIFEVGSIIWIFSAILLIKFGVSALKILWFPLFFMLFMIPLPGTLIILLTMPMKMAVSYVTEHILFWADYPISRSGVILQIGQYQLLVADACAGLQTLLTLESLGLFYLNVVRHTSAFRNITLALLIIPISFSANVIRVMALTLITYYLGDDAGQGFLHKFSGMFLFLSALFLILSMDSLLQYIVRKRAKKVLI